MSTNEKGLKPGTLIPNFSLVSTEGETFSAKQFLGTPFLLYFLRGTW